MVVRPDDLSSTAPAPCWRVEGTGRGREEVREEAREEAREERLEEPLDLQRERES